MKGKGIFFIVIIMAVTFLAVSTALAAEKQSGEKSKGFLNKLLNYPAKVVEKSGTTVTNATRSSTDVVSRTAKDTASVVSGDFKKTKDMLVEPVKGSAETVYATAKETVSIPVDAAKEVDTE